MRRAYGCAPGRLAGTGDAVVIIRRGVRDWAALRHVDGNAPSRRRSSRGPAWMTTTQVGTYDATAAVHERASGAETTIARIGRKPNQDSTADQQMLAPRRHLLSLSMLAASWP